MFGKKLMLSFTIIYLTRFFVLLSVIWGAVGVNAQADNGVIAYVSSSIGNKQIHVVNPDGSQEKTLWAIPWEVHANDRIGSLSWNPDGTELAFDSGHNWQRSLNVRDLYAISADGTGLRKMTSPPGAEGSSNYPTGTVKFWVRASEQGDVQIYVEGAKEPTKYFAKLSKDYQVTLEVADWGEGVRQHIRLFDPDDFYSACRYSEEGWVDIIPGQEVDLEGVPFRLGQTCPRLQSPSWSQDGSRILYFVYPNEEIRSVSTDRSSRGPGPVVHEWHSIIQSEKYYRAVFAPTAIKENEALMLYHSSFRDFVYHMTINNSATEKKIDLGLCPELTCDILDIDWLPDGSGFIFSQREMVLSGYNGVLYRYTFADKALTAILRLTGENIGNIDISPDGTSIVFERILGQNYGIDHNWRGPSVSCPCSLWTINSDGNEMKQLVADGRAPVWGKTASSIPTAETSPIDKFFNWAEAEYPQYFPTHQTSQDIFGYYARHYRATDVYLGTKDGRVYAYGKPFGGLLDAGDLQQWLQKSGQ